MDSNGRDYDVNCLDGSLIHSPTSNGTTEVVSSKVLHFFFWRGGGLPTDISIDIGRYEGVSEKISQQCEGSPQASLRIMLRFHGLPRYIEVPTYLGR